MKDYYKTLGLSKSASAEDIKKAYRALALKHHPDKNNGDQKSCELFKEISEAYSVLSDKDRRRNYDNLNIFGKTSSNFTGFNSNYSSKGFSSFWENIRSVPKIVKTSITITFEESILGVSKPIKYSFFDNCTKCDPALNANSTDFIDCRRCSGSGKEMHQQGYVSIFTPCRECGGSGRVKSSSCEVCGGAKKISVNAEATLAIPAGIISGNILRITNKDKNLTTMVKVIVNKSSIFERKGIDIYSSINITLKEALLGCTREVDLVRTSKTISIPSCVSFGTKLRIKGQGSCKVGDNKVGDHFIEINIKMPESLTENQVILAKNLE